jgi:hypothetical protein
MSKKYQIINSNTDTNSDECTIFYILYIVLFFVIIFIIYKIIFCWEKKKEGFQNDSMNAIDKSNLKTLVMDLDLNARIPDKNLISSKVNTPQQIMEDLKEKNKELKTIKDTLENKLIEQSQAIFLSQNFNKVDSSSFNDNLTYLLVEFADTKFPELDMEDKKIVNTQTELDTVLAEAKGMKNFYKPGDIVQSSSTFGITKDDICYRHNNKPIKPTPEFMKKYPNCMVCAIEDDKNLTNTQGWKNTKTNISKVCLYDPKATPKTGTPNLAQCKTFCNIK